MADENQSTYLRIIIAVILFIMCILGLIGNNVMAIVIFSKAKLRQLPVGMLIALTAIANITLCVSFVGVINTELSVYTNQRFFQQHCIFTNFRRFKR